MQYYSKYNKGYEIVQTYLDKISLDVLYERNPVVIYDSIKTPKQLLGTLFKYSYLFKNEYKIEHQQPTISKSKFSFVYSADEQRDVFLNLINPSYTKSLAWKTDKGGHRISTTSLEESSVQYITIKMKPYQVVIIPSHWILQADASLHKVDLQDMISLLYFSWY